jgi:hypothetical protein
MKRSTMLDRAYLGALLFAVPAVSFAAAIDVEDVVTDIGAQIVPVGLIGAAVLLLIVAIKAYKWVRRAL